MLTNALKKKTPNPNTRCRKVPFMLAASAVAVACGTSGVQPSTPPSGALARDGVAVRPGATAPKFTELRERLLEQGLAYQPSWGRGAGLHEYDAQLTDYRPAAFTARIRVLETQSRELSAVDRSALTDEELLDLELLEVWVRHQHFRLADWRVQRADPATYQELFDVSGYLNFDYAPFEERARKLIEHEEAALSQLDVMFANLAPVLSKPVVETAIKIYTGYASYLRGDVKAEMEKVQDPALRARFSAANLALAAGAEGIADRLTREFLPRADLKSHVLGLDRYLRFVAAQEGRPISLDALQRMATEDLERNKSAYRALAKSTRVTRPTRDELFDAARNLVETSRQFVIDNELVTIPSEDRATVSESPPYMRWNAAFLNQPGPFDTAKQAYYYVTLPDPAWPAAEQEAYIFPHGTLLSTTVHEVYPGHFLHGLWIRRAPTRTQKLMDSYSFSEGWAHYVEQMLVEQGYGAEDPQNRLGQLADALLRNCRFVVSIGVHAGGMSLAEAEERFVDDCFQDRATAREQAVRSTFDPGFFAYTLGKLQILELRAEAQRRLGERFNLKAFHDAVLSYGASPVSLTRERVLRKLGAGAEPAAKAVP